MLTVGLLAAYYVLRTLGAQCSGSACDTYFTPLSVLLPILILIMAAVTGLSSIAAARQGAWFGLLSVCTLLGILGPVVSAVVWRDHPNTFVLVATLFVLLVPLSALIYSVSRVSSGKPAG
jgi:hypothetical protein